jgi:hypothetical protein
MKACAIPAVPMDFEVSAWRTKIMISETQIAKLGGIRRFDSEEGSKNEALEEFELLIGTKLPDAYRHFLLAYGMCRFYNSMIFGSISKIRNVNRGPFAHFYGLPGSTREEWETIVGKYNTYRGRMPDTIIPIAAAGNGDQICIGIDEREVGKIFYWDHENEWDEEDYLEDYGEPMPDEEKFRNVYLVAETFEDFVTAFVVEPS